jgi:hypothetical protein
MAFAQLAYRESPRDIEACLRVHQHKLYHMGIRSRVVRSPQSALRRQRAARLAHLCRFRPGTNPGRTSFLRRRRPGSRTRQHYLRTLSLNHRFVSVRITLGFVPLHKIRPQISHLAESAWQYPSFYSHFQRQTARSLCTRYSIARSWGFLHHGSGLCGCRTALHSAPRMCVLRYPCQTQYPVSTPLFLSAGRIDPCEVRPELSIDGGYNRQRLSATPEKWTPLVGQCGSVFKVESDINIMLPVRAV